MRRTELCCQLRKEALPAKKQPQYIALSTHYPTWVMRSWYQPLTLCHPWHSFFSQRTVWTRLFWQRYPHMSTCRRISSHSLPPSMVTKYHRAVACCWQEVSKDTTTWWSAPGRWSPTEEPQSKHLLHPLCKWQGAVSQLSVSDQQRNSDRVKVSEDCDLPKNIC